MSISRANGVFEGIAATASPRPQNGSNTTPISYGRFNASRVVPTAGENRPVNVAVRYLIRAAS